MRYDSEKVIRIEELDIAEKERISSFDIDFSLFSNCYILPGFTDVHVHLREPGFLYKETIKSGTMAAAAGGFTDIFSMPNLNPCPDSIEHLAVQLEAIKNDAKVKVHPYGSISVNEEGMKLAELEEISDNVIAFTDDGRGVASADMMREAMMRAKKLGKIIAAHCEDESFPKDSPQAEWKQLERDIELVRQTGCSYHMCHVSCSQSLELIRSAKREGLDITCETAPHYLTIANDEIENDGRFKMNPPIKTPVDREALIEALRDGTIDMIATDHAPHSEEEKSRGFIGSAFGIVGLETAFPVLYTELVLRDKLSLDRLIEALYEVPRRRFGLDVFDRIKDNLDSDLPDFSIWDLDEEYMISPEEFYSKGKSSPFKGWKVKGRCLATIAAGNKVFIRK